MNEQNMNEQNRKDKIKVFLTLHFSFFLMSISGICSKTAAQSDSIWSWNFIIFYNISSTIQIFFVYQWQQILKVIPLSVAYVHRAVNLIWGMLWGFLIFSETIRPAMLLGSALVIFGLYVMSGRSS